MRISYYLEIKYLTLQRNWWKRGGQQEDNGIKRMGRPSKNKPKLILVKCRDWNIIGESWKLKGSDIIIEKGNVRDVVNEKIPF